MKRIGYWMDNLFDDDLPVPQELVGEMPESVRDAVCNYLRNGRHFGRYLGCGWCHFLCGAKGPEMGFHEYTDGEWVWPGSLAHYVREHGVLLPEEFVARATGSTTTADKQLRSRTASLDYWIQWSSQRRSPEIRNRLANALAAARAAEPMFINKLIQELIEREGESSEPCVFAGCSKPALVGCRICARHAFHEDMLNMRTGHLYILPYPL